MSEPEDPPAVGYLHGGIDDAGQSIPAEWFDTVTGWAVGALELPRHTVLVHCEMGINRAPSAGFAILLAQGWAVGDVLNTLHAGRPFASIAYPEDALRWHHVRAWLPLQLRREDQRALRAWRATHESAMAGGLRALLTEPWADTETGGLNRRDIRALSESLGPTTAVRKGLTCPIMQ